MLNIERDEKDVAESVRLLRQAMTILNIVRSTRIAEIEVGVRRGGQRERRIQEMLQSATKRISSMYGDLEKLAPRRSDRSLINFPHEPPPQTVKWGGGPPPQWVYDAAEQERLAAPRPPVPPPRPPAPPADDDPPPPSPPPRPED